MSKVALSLVAASVLASFASAAGPGVYKTGASLTFTAFDTVTGGPFDDLPATHFCVAVGDSMAAATHLVVGPLEAQTDNLIGGEYVIVDATGEELGGGMLAFECPVSQSSSPIVGIIPLPGAWDNADITVTTPPSTLGGKTASMSYSPTAGAATLDIDGTPSQFTYVVENVGAVRFEAPFWISSGATTIKFTEGFIDRMDNGSYKGLVHTDFSGDLADSVFMVTAADPNDADADSVPDIVDNNYYWYMDCDYETRMDSGAPGKVYSGWLGNFWFFYPPRHEDAWNGYLVENHCFFWHEQHGYLYGEAMTDGNGTRWAIFYDYNMGWLATSAECYPYIYAYNVRVGGDAEYGSTWLYFVPASGFDASRVFYVYDGELADSSSFGSDELFKGWWQIPGAYDGSL